MLQRKQITIINILIATVDLNLYSTCGCPLHPYSYRHLCMWLCQKKMLKETFAETLKPPSLLLRPPWFASELLPFHKVECEEVFCGMAMLRTEEGSFYRDFPTSFSTGIQIPPGSHRHVLYTRKIEICVSAHLSFLVLVSLQEINCYGFTDWEKFNPQFISFIHSS